MVDGGTVETSATDRGNISYTGADCEDVRCDRCVIVLYLVCNAY